MQINSPVVLARSQRLVSHASLADHPSHTELFQDVSLIRLLTDGCRGAGSHHFPLLVFIFQHNWAAVINNATLEVDARRQLPSLVKILVHGIATGEHHAGNQNLIANL